MLAEMESGHPGYLVPWYEGLIAFFDGDKRPPGQPGTGCWGSTPEEWLAFMLALMAWCGLTMARARSGTMRKPQRFNPAPLYGCL